MRITNRRGFFGIVAGLLGMAGAGGLKSVAGAGESSISRATVGRIPWKKIEPAIEEEMVEVTIVTKIVFNEKDCSLIYETEKVLLSSRMISPRIE